MDNKIQNLKKQIEAIKKENEHNLLEVETKKQTLSKLRSENEKKRDLSKKERVLAQNLEDFKKKVEEKLEIVELLESSNHLDEEFTEKQIAEQLKEKDNMIASIKQEIVEKQRELERLTQ